MRRATAEIIREYGPFSGGNHVGGVTYDGHNVWVALGDKLSSVDPATEFNERAARALCDRETQCGRVGAGKTLESADACMAQKRHRARRALDAALCSEVRGDRVADCLAAIRRASCGPAGEPLIPPPECTEHTLCDQSNAK